MEKKNHEDFYRAQALTDYNGPAVTYTPMQCKVDEKPVIGGRYNPARDQEPVSRSCLWQN